MKAKNSALGSFVWVLVAIALVGCATHSIDWNGRIGSYTHDQAVLELGPPDKSAQLTDGTVVGEWLVYRGRPGYTQRVYTYRSVWDTYDPPIPDRLIRLTFGPDGVLQAWRKVVR